MACYLRNGTKARRALPCNHTAIVEGKHTSCCDPDDLCLTNGLCRDPAANSITNFAWFFGCTDQTFKDPSCGNYCDKANKGNNHLVFQCTQNETWCCNTGEPAPAEERINHTNTTCCSISELVFTAAAPIVYTTALNSGIPFSVGTLTTTATASTASLKSTVISTVSNATSSVNALNTGGASIPAAPQSKSPSLAIGLGTGLGSFAVIALGVGFFFVWRRSKQVTETPPSELTSDGRQEIISGAERFEIMGATAPKENRGDVYRAELLGELPVELPGDESTKQSTK